MDIVPFFKFVLGLLHYEDKLQLLRLLYCFATVSSLKQLPDSNTLALKRHGEDDLVMFKLNGYLGEALPTAYIPMFNYLKENYCQELLEDGSVYPSQEYLCKVYPEMLRSYLSFSKPVLNCTPPFPFGFERKLQIVLESLNIQSVCDLTANGGDERVLLSSVLSWMVTQNNSVEEDPNDYVLYDAVIDYDFLHYGGFVAMVSIEEAAKLRTDKYVLVITHLNDSQPDYLKEGRLKSIWLLEWDPKKENEIYVLVFDMHGGHDRVEYPEEGKSFSYEELQAKGYYLNYDSVGLVWHPKPVGWKPIIKDKVRR